MFLASEGFTNVLDFPATGRIIEFEVRERVDKVALMPWRSMCNGGS